MRTLGFYLLLGCTVGCAKPNATNTQLLRRAAFDLQCDQANLQVVHIDELTRGVQGCNRSGVYVEVCDGPKRGEGALETNCTWVINTAEK